MNKTNEYRRAGASALLALLLAALLCLSSFALAGCSGGTPEDTSPVFSDTAEATVSDPGFSLHDRFVIVRPNDSDKYEKEAFQLIRRAVASACGLNLETATDFVRDEEAVQAGEYEILIGNTNRTASSDVITGLGSAEGVYRVVNENVVVIAGGSPEATLAAAYAFAEDVLGYVEDAKTGLTISAGTSPLLHTGDAGSASAAFPVILLNGVDLRNFTLVGTSGSTSLNTLRHTIASLCGAELPVKTLSDYRAAGGASPAIFFGCADTESGRIDRTYDGYTYYMSVRGTKIAVDFDTSSSVLAKKVADDLGMRFFAKPDSVVDHKGVNVPDGEYSSIPSAADNNGLMISERSDEKLAAGIVYSEILYRDKDGKPVRVYAVTVDAGCGTFVSCVPGDADAEKEGVVATVMDQMRVAAANGKNVIVGTNSGFFDINNTDLSRGIVVKDGKLLRPTGNRPFFAAMNDGSLKILAPGDYNANASLIKNAVGGNAILLREGKAVNLALGTEMSATRHPRTAIGIRADGGAVLLVVDGRQPAISNGASYVDLVGIFRDLGCTEALNLDGGGSSTFIRKDPSGSFRLENSPSDGSMRAVQDCLFIVLP